MTMFIATSAGWQRRLFDAEREKASNSGEHHDSRAAVGGAHPGQRKILCICTRVHGDCKVKCKMRAAALR